VLTKSETKEPSQAGAPHRARIASGGIVSVPKEGTECPLREWPAVAGLWFLVLCAGLLLVPRPGWATCGGGFLNPISDINWECVFPIKIAGITIVPGDNDLPDPATSPICFCPAPPPVFMRPGIPLSMWEPARMIETVKEPFCFPSLGAKIGTMSPGLLGGSNGGGEAKGGRKANTFAQAHYWIFPVWTVLEVITDVACLEITGLDVGYLTELDPLWNDDSLAAIVNPEAVLFANPVAQLSCTADSISAVAGKPLSPLFWCMGSWGSAYPMSGRTGNSKYVEGNAAIAAKMIYKLCRQLMICDPGVNLCMCTPTPIWVKHNYLLQLAKPRRQAGCSCIGRTGMIWDHAMNFPAGGDNFLWMIFRKRACCVL